MKITIAITIISLILLFACTPTKESKTNNSVYDPSDASTLMELKKSPCFGKCPVFEMTISKNGKVTYNGQRFTEKMGKFTKQLSEAALNDLNKKFADTDVFQYKDEYRVEVTDLPSTNIAYHADGKSKTIGGNGTFPDPVVALVKALDEIANSDGWDLVGADPSLPKHFIQNEFLIQLKKGVNAHELANKFVAQKLAVKKQIAPTSNLWLFSYDSSTLSPKKMLETIKASDNVVEAEFNKRLETRN